MEILGRNIPTLQNAIASGLESVRAGIAESAKASGVAALGIAQDSFSFEQTQIASSVDLPAVSGAAEYPGPNQYFHQFPNVATDSPISSLEISKTLVDPNFDVPKALETFSNNSESMVDSALKLYDTIEQRMQDFANRKQKEIEEKQEKIDDIKNFPAILAKNRLGQDQSDAASVNTEGGYSASDRFGRDKVKGTAAESVAGAGNAQPLLEIGPIGKMLGMHDVSYSAADRFGRDKAKGTSMEGAAASGSSDGASNRSIIVVGGKTDSPASDRSIIVVGGKTSGTYLQTIDDSLSQLQKNPTPETSNLFTQQFSVVRDMVSTVGQTVNLQQTVASNRFTSLR